jgi:hypothetical protein
MSTLGKSDETAHWATTAGLLDIGREGERLDASVRSGVQELLHRYAFAYDEARLDLLAGCFTDDAVCSTRLRGTEVAHFEGRDRIVSGMSAVMAQQGSRQRRHLFGNVVVERVADQILRAHAYAAVFVVEPRAVGVGATAVYRVDIQEDGAGLRIRHLIIGMDGYVDPLPDAGAADES